ncbi:ogr/Delta-like zinc finger family protein [candidate division KSB1 bacterium]
MSDKKRVCPYCDGNLLKWQSPPESSWGGEILAVCFNDECPYYVRGWKWMMEKFQQNASYRYCVNLKNGREYPLPVWSKNAHKDFIVHD